METIPNADKYFVGVKFPGTEKSYYFSTSISDLKIGDLVVVETVTGYEMATVSTALMSLEVYKSSLELKPIVRRPDKHDLEAYEYYLKEGKRALRVAAQEIKILDLPMDLINAVYTLDGAKVTITYTSPEKRVDFRELLRNLAGNLRCRIELRQIAARDKARMIGGLGTCGLPLCCSTFLNSFEGVSIGKAKNQMLVLNLEKLSGACGKLVCCLAFEDDAYTEAKKEFPKIDQVVHLDEGDYKVRSFNIISKTVQLISADRNIKTFSLEDTIALINGTYKKVEVVDRRNENNPVFEFELAQKQDQQKNQSNENGKNRQNRNNQNRQSPNHRRNNNNQNRQSPQKTQQNQTNASPKNNNQNHQNHHHFRHNNKRNKGNNGGKAS